MADTEEPKKEETKEEDSGLGAAPVAAPMSLMGTYTTPFAGDEKLRSVPRESHAVHCPTW